MKTTTDIGSFLKRITSANANTPASLTLLHDGKAFIVKCGDDSSKSAYLDDALENLAEARRRRANGMEAVRETKWEPSPASAPAATSPTGNAQAAPCAKCGGRGYTIFTSGGTSYMSYCSCAWNSFRYTAAKATP